jgi:beta-xylosidase
MVGADPHAVVVGGRVWLYPTHHLPGVPGFHAFSSSDLRRWEDHGPVLKFADVDWIDDDGEAVHYPWAPALAEKGGKFYLYYSVGPQGRTPARIGVAKGDSPRGPFKDSGRPLLTGGNGFEAIDPVVFQDPKSRKYYFYAGGSAGATLRIFELKPDMVTLGREIPVETPPKFTEGPFVHYRNGTYYLSYSHGGWRSSSYSSHYATSNTPYGPWRYRGAILTSDAAHKGPGHHSIFRGAGPDKWFIAYHRWNGAQGDGPYSGHRQVAIEPLEHERDGSLRPVKMTDVVPEWRPTAQGN